MFRGAFLFPFVGDRPPPRFSAPSRISKMFFQLVRVWLGRPHCEVSDVSIVGHLDHPSQDVFIPQKRMRILLKTDVGFRKLAVVVKSE